MAALEDFEHTLQEVVNAKRLSASKMNKLTEIAMKSIADDTKLVAILYRTHKSLPSFAKVSSLYAFDALARAARSLVNKRGITGDINSAMGNPATFLLKIEGVLDGLFHDMATLDNSEAKEKTKKVLDIWVKSNTFPSAVLTRLRDILSDIRKETAVNPTLPTDPHTTLATITTSPSAPRSPPAAPPDVQATLLALLGQAAQITGQGQPPIQTPPNTDSQLQQSQLALLQQLALTAKLANGSPTPPSGQTPPPIDRNTPLVAIPAPESSHSSSGPSQTGGSRFDTPKDAPYARNGYADCPRDRRDFRDERHLRGSFRGRFRGRGRWDDHHSRDRFRQRDPDWDPPLRPRRSRSRSPHRPEERRNVRPNSPPRHGRDPHHQPESSPPPSCTHDKDEFGRDIRVTSNSPSRSSTVEDTQAHARMESSVDPTPGVLPDCHTPVSDQLPMVAASTSAQSTETRTPSAALQQQQPGLDQFDISAFDATAPSSWEALGNMWRTTYGYPPSQEELMQFMMTGSMAVAGMSNGGFNTAQGGQWQQGNWDGHGPRHNGGWRGGRGRGDYVGGRGGGHGNYGDGGEHTEPSSYAIGDDEQDHTDEVHDSTLDAGQTGGRGGRMQRVGDRWMFVRDPVESGTP